MKNILFSLIFVLLAGSLWAQQQTDVLQQMEHRIHNDPLMEQYANPDQDQMIDGEMDFLMPNMQNSETVIRVDSAFYSSQYLDYKQLRMYDPNGNMLTNHILKWKDDKWEDSRLLTYAYDINNNVLIYLNQEARVGGWRNRIISFYTYDNQNNILSHLIQKLGFNDRRYTYTYDSKGNILYTLSQELENDSWVDISSHIYTYDANGNRLTSIGSTRGSNFLVPSSKNTFTYDSNRNMLTDLYQYWGYGEWVNSSLKTYTYDANGNELTNLGQSFNDSILVNYRLYTYTYDAMGNMLTYLQQKFDNEICINNYLATYTYDINGNKLSHLNQKWDNDTWEILEFYTYTYNSMGNRLTYLYQFWGDSTWVNIKKREYVFLEGKVNATAYNWDGANWIKAPITTSLRIIMEGEMIFNCSAIDLELFYSDFSGIEDPQTNPESIPILCYPNPVTDQINIEIDPTLQAKKYHLELFSQTGQKVKSFEISSNIGSSIAPIKVDDVPPGLYLLRIEAGKQIFSQKIIISR